MARTTDVSVAAAAPKPVARTEPAPPKTVRAEPAPPPPSSSSLKAGAPVQGASPRSASDMLEGMGTSDLDDVGRDLPAYELEPLALGPGGVRGVLQRRDRAALAQIAQRLGRDWWVALDFGGSEDAETWSKACAEGQRAWSKMKPGKIKHSDGSVSEGVSPSGAPRGDRFVQVHDLEGGDASWCTVRELHDTVSALGTALEEHLISEPRLGMHIIGRTDTLFACFPGGGAKYNNHVRPPACCRTAECAPPPRKAMPFRACTPPHQPALPSSLALAHARSRRSTTAVRAMRAN